MLFPSLYEELNMQHYADLVTDVIPDRNVLIALYDDSGQLVWASDESNTLVEFMAVCEKRWYANNAHGEFSCVEFTHNGSSVFCCRLGDLAGRLAGELVFYDISDDTGIVSTQVSSILCRIAKIVKDELGYLYEVNAMAGELGERYDELSMLRTSDLAMIEYQESRHILSTYIRNCAEHLQVDYAAIWIPSRQEIYPGGIIYKHESPEILVLIEKLSAAAYVMFENGGDGFGINNKDELLRKKIKLPADKKVLLVPVLDGTGKTCGVLTCMNEFYNKDFTNSDKATLEAVSRKTYKYLLSTQDELTGVLNKKGFEESIWREIDKSEYVQYLVLFNIDQFSVINAAYGMNIGDEVLSTLADTLTESEHALKFVARLDADVFSALIEASSSEIENRVSEICNVIDKKTISLGSKNLTVNIRAGVIALNSKETAVSDHLYAAELALNSAKEKTKNRVVIYKPGNTALLKRKHQLTQVENIKLALQEDRFVLYCQRIVPLSGDEIHYEILVRMIDETGNLVAPDDFIPVAERYNLMHLVDRWIINHAFKLLSKDGYREISENYKWGINLSGMTISDPDFHDYVSSCLHKYNFQPTNLYFEITETAAIKNFQNCSSFMNKIHSLGVQFALDDFGSGLSSFSYLKKLSIDYLKIDGSLVKDIVNSRLDQTMVSAIADIAEVMNVKTIAEYVENDLILNELKSLNIDYAQGYGIMKPRAVEEELQSLCETPDCRLCKSN